MCDMQLGGGLGSCSSRCRVDGGRTAAGALLAWMHAGTPSRTTAPQHHPPLPSLPSLAQRSCRRRQPAATSRLRQQRRRPATPHSLAAAAAAAPTAREASLCLESSCRPSCVPRSRGSCRLRWAAPVQGRRRQRRRWAATSRRTPPQTILSFPSIGRLPSRVGATLNLPVVGKAAGSAESCGLGGGCTAKHCSRTSEARSVACLPASPVACLPLPGCARTHAFAAAPPSAAAVAAGLPDKPAGVKYRHQWFQSPDLVEVGGAGEKMWRRCRCPIPCSYRCKHRPGCRSFLPALRQPKSPWPLLALLCCASPFFVGRCCPPRNARPTSLLRRGLLQVGAAMALKSHGSTHTFLPAARAPLPYLPGGRACQGAEEGAGGGDRRGEAPASGNHQRRG